jgi:hypothetical protein
MRKVLIAVLLLFSLVPALAAPPPDNSAIIGLWTSKMASLPTIMLTVEEENGKLIGAVLFYLIRRNPSGPPSASPGVPEPLIEPTFDGKTLTFKVSHRHAHPGTEHDPPVTFRFELTSANKLKGLNGEGPPVEMVRNTPY